MYSTPLKNIRYIYSSDTKYGYFNIPKIIFGETGINNPVIDLDGKYGITTFSIGIPLNNNLENLLKCLKSNNFKNFLKACSWSNYRIDWRLFCYLKEDFYDYFI